MQLHRFQEVTENSPVLGVLLQLLVPEEVIDKVAYASGAYGQPDPKFEPLSKTLKELRENPRQHSGMQVRIMAQHLMVPEHKITVILYGLLDFFTVKEADLKENDTVKLNQLQEAVRERDAIQQEARTLFRDDSQNMEKG